MWKGKGVKHSFDIRFNYTAYLHLTWHAPFEHPWFWLSALWLCPCGLSTPYGQEMNVILWVLYSQRQWIDIDIIVEDKTMKTHQKSFWVWRIDTCSGGLSWRYLLRFTVLLLKNGDLMLFHRSRNFSGPYKEVTLPHNGNSSSMCRGRSHHSTPAHLGERERETETEYDNTHATLLSDNTLHCTKGQGPVCMSRHYTNDNAGLEVLLR